MIPISSIRWLFLLFALAITAACAHLSAQLPLRPNGLREQSSTIIVDTAAHDYVIPLGGLLDEANTRDYRNPYHYFPPGFQPNRAVIIENIGPVAVRNPRVVVDGRGPAWSLEELITRIVRPGDSDADKARAAYEWNRDEVNHGTESSGLSADALTLYNTLGYGLCYENCKALAQMWEACGLPSYMGYPSSHSTSVVQYDGGTHLLDGNFRTFFLDRHNEIILPEEALARDHDLVYRGTGSFPVLVTPEKRNYYVVKYAGMQRSLSTRSKPVAINPARSTPDVWLRPGETIAWTWQDVDDPFRWHSLKNSASHRFLHLFKGRLIYAPEMTPALFEQPNVTAQNLAIERREGSPPALAPQNTAQPAALNLKTTVPTILLDADLEIEMAADAPAVAPPALAIRLDTGAELKVDWETDAAQPAVHRANLKSQIGAAAANASARNTLTVILRWPAGQTPLAPLVRYHQNLTFQVNQSAMPGLRLGENRAAIRHDGPAEGGRLRVRHDWVESWESAPPSAPVPLSPMGTVSTLQPEFRWEFDSSDDQITTGHIHLQVFDREDMRWPVANALEPLYPAEAIPHGRTQWTPHRPGLVTHGRTYWWRVRAANAAGVWGPWSQVASFVPQGPMPPEDVQIEERDGGWRLTWQPNPRGTAPVAYEIHASTQQGFTAYDQPYTLLLPASSNKWHKFDELDPVQPPTLFGRSGNPFFDISDDLGESCQPHVPSYFRVRAIDAQGARSDTSDFAAMPSPRLLAPAAVAIAPGQPVKIPVAVTHSLGRYVCRQTNEAVYDHKFWDRQEPQLRAEALPDWLALDEECGLLTGTAPEDFEGSIEVRITAFDARDPANRHARTISILAK